MTGDTVNRRPLAALLTGLLLAALLAASCGADSSRVNYQNGDTTAHFQWGED